MIGDQTLFYEENEKEMEREGKRNDEKEKCSCQVCMLDAYT
jgi:hypothetical protein